ncbi:hypothetical protein N9L19_01305 [bacterium]|nr:hypothetical protein [bacterium]
MFDKLRWNSVDYAISGVTDDEMVIRREASTQTLANIVTLQAQQLVDKVFDDQKYAQACQSQRLFQATMSEIYQEGT